MWWSRHVMHDLPHFTCKILPYTIVYGLVSCGFQAQITPNFKGVLLLTYLVNDKVRHMSGLVWVSSFLECAYLPQIRPFRAWKCPKPHGGCSAGVDSFPKFSWKWRGHDVLHINLYVLSTQMQTLQCLISVNGLMSFVLGLEPKRTSHGTTY